MMRLAGIFDATAEGMDTETAAAYLSTLYRTGFCKASAKEIEALSKSVSQNEPSSLGDIPLIVLTVDTSEADLQAQIPPYLSSAVSPEVIRKVFEANEAMQEELVTLSSRGRQIMVPNSKHMMQVDHPEVVIDAICEVMGQAN